MELLRQCPRANLIQATSAGYNRLGLDGINKLGIPVASNGGANAVAVAEHTIALMICVGKRTMLQWDVAVRQRAWREELQELELFELTNKTVGIIGLGPVGRHVAKRLTGFDTRTIYHDTVEVPLEVQKDLKAQPVPMDELLRGSDIVGAHVPLTRRTRGMISERELAMMKPSAVLINTCRGPVVGEEALYRALVDGQIAAAGLDVLEEEPPSKDNPLLDLGNVVVTPHMAYQSVETSGRAAEFAYANISRALAEETPQSLAIPE